jgi:hypothetical protein
MSKKTSTYLKNKSYIAMFLTQKAQLKAGLFEEVI